MSEGDYVDLKTAVQGAGYHATSLERIGGPDMPQWARITVVSHRAPDGRLNGNSFWITKIGEQWYCGTWGSWLYQIPDSDTVINLALEFLATARGKIDDFREELKQTHRLRPLLDEEFDELVRGSV